MNPPTVSALMRTNFVSAGPDDSLLEADRIMRLGRIRHLPVVEKGILVGLLSHRDVLAASISRLERCDPAERLEHLRGVPIRAVMTRELEVGTEQTTLADAARRMLRLKIGCLPIVRSLSDGAQVLVGLLTESDLLRAA